MLLRRSDLSARLRQQIEQRYLVCGKELYLVERCSDVIRERAKGQGFEECVFLNANRDFNWNSLYEHTSSLSLFSPKKFIQLRLPESGRVGTQGSAALTSCLDYDDDSIVLLLIAGYLDTQVKRANWYRAWEKKAIVVNNPELKKKQFSDWISRSLHRRNIRHEPMVVDRLAYYFEGNMLAAANELRKIVLGYEGDLLTVNEIDRIIIDQARFNIFTLIDACLVGNIDRAVRLLRILRTEGTEPIIVQWALAREARNIYKVAFALSKGLPLKGVFQQMRIWQSRQRMLTAAARRIGLEGSMNSLRQIAKADRILKGREDSQIGGSIWNEYERIVLTLCGSTIMQGES